MAYKALIIGVDEYIDKKSFVPLDNVANDVQAITQILNNSACKYDTTVLTGQSATFEYILHCIDDFFINCDTEDILFLYWAGHGMSNVFIAYNTESQRLSKTTIKMNDIKDTIENSKAETVVSIFDCCYSGSMVRAHKRMPNMKIVGEGKVIITSSDYYQISHESKSSGHGLFTTYFLEGLMGEAASKNGDITLSGLYSYICKQMGQCGISQTPIMHGTFVGEVLIDKI